MDDYKIPAGNGNFGTVSVCAGEGFATPRCGRLTQPFGGIPGLFSGCSTLGAQR